MFKRSSPNEFQRRRFSLAIIGETLDDRGNDAVTYARSVADKVLSLKYLPLSLQLNVDGTMMEVFELENFFSPYVAGGILLEATTLGFAEILICCRSFHNAASDSLYLVYVEPRSYHQSESARKVVQQRDFELSDEIVGYKPIPGAIASLDQVPDSDQPVVRNVIFLLGFEGERIDRALEDLPIDPKRCDVVFGVPGYRPGWELDAFANNIRVLAEAEFGREPRFCGADNPLAVLELLEKVYAAQLPGNQMFVAPIGTKPHGIGAAVFACTHDDIGILYDHPTRKEGRSQMTGAWHLFQIVRD